MQAASTRRDRGLDPRASPRVRASAWEAQVASYTQLAEARGKLQNRIWEANRYVRHLEGERAENEKMFSELRATLSALGNNADVIARQLSQFAAACGTEEDDENAKRFKAMELKARGLSEDATAAADALDAGVVREVPLVYHGVADEVEVRGTWDDWLSGLRLSPEEQQIGGAAETEFRGTLKLKPGRYELKFVVDGCWRIVPGWPTVGFGLDENMVLDVV